MRELMVDELRHLADGCTKSGSGPGASVVAFPLRRKRARQRPRSSSTALRNSDKADVHANYSSLSFFFLLTTDNMPESCVRE